MIRHLLLATALLAACAETPRPQPGLPNPDGPDLAQPAPADLTGIVVPIVDLTEPTPVISSVVPARTSTAGGAQITINGSGFSPDATVFLNGLPTQRITSTGTQITIVAPPAPGAFGKVPLVVRNPQGAQVTSLAFSYYSSTVTYGAGVPLPLGSSPYGAATGDFNKDGMLDLAVGQDGSVFTILLNQGAGNFNRADYGGCSTIYSVKSSDINGDGNLDLLMACYSNNYLGFYSGQAGGTFGGLTNTTANVDRPNQLVVADFDGDGKLDAVTSAISAYFYMYKGNGNGTFAAQTSYGTASSSVYGLAAADLNKDNRVDVVTANSGNSTVDIFYGNGDLTFQGRQNYSGFSDPQYLEIADFDGDGYPEIVVSNQGNHTLSIMKNTNGVLNGANKITLSTATSPREVKVADINGDGYLDLAVLCTQNNPGNRVSIFLGKGDGTFTGRVDVATNTQSSFGMVLGNFYGQKQDIVVMQRGASPYTAVLLQNISQ